MSPASQTILVLGPARSFNPQKPWPTFDQRSGRIAQAIASIVLVEFVLNGLQNVLPGPIMLFLWLGVGGLVAVGTLHIENFMMKKWRHR
jgi:hypothetical protein